MVRRLVSKVQRVDLRSRAAARGLKKLESGIGRADVAMHDRWKRIKWSQMFFIFTEATHRFGIVLLVFAFKGCELSSRPLLSLMTSRSQPIPWRWGSALG